jgi:endonuclease-3 related protein
MNGKLREVPDIRVRSIARIQQVYRTLLASFGPQGWWPGDGPFDVMVGAVLTQNTSWKNVEHALRRFDEAQALRPQSLAALAISQIEELARPAGSYRRKAQTLSALSRRVAAFPGGLEGYLSRDTAELREGLLETPGIGPETADSILLYAAGRSRFVVDAYARRFAERHGLSRTRAPYDELRLLFEDALGPRVDTLGECHALLVELGKRFCRSEPTCEKCPLNYDL